MGVLLEKEKVPEMSTYSRRAPAALAASRRRRDRRLRIIVSVLVAVVLAVLAALYLYDKSRADVIASGVKISGVGVGGLTRAAAATKLRSEFVAPLANRTIAVSFQGRSWSIYGHEARVRANIPATAAQALSVGRQGTFVSRAVRDLFGGGVDRDIPLLVTVSGPALKDFTSRVVGAVNQPPQNARVQASSSGLGTVQAHPGVSVQSGLLMARVEHSLVNPSAPAAIAVPVVTRPPHVTAAQLAAKYPAYILVDRGDYSLRFYSHLKLTDTYPIAVGMQGLQTPAGLYHIQWKQVDPPWYVPNDAWAGPLAGKTIPPGPQDPLKARFLSFDGAAGIHGIDPSEYGTIGHNASHGCIRMKIPDVIDLYSKSPVGTPVYIL